MYKLCIFAGTTEGRLLAEFLRGQEIRVTVCVATDYGRQLLSEGENITVSAKPLDGEQMRLLFAREQFDLVVDATHPYAARVTENIVSGCRATGTEYQRLLRRNSESTGDGVYVPNAAAAAEYLKGTTGPILLTTGSKELAKFSSLSHRIFARVLPMVSSLNACQAAGIKPANILALQGPFSEEMNVQMLRWTKAKYLVTKDGGSTGGFGEKAAAAQRENVSMVIIGRPSQVDGLSLGEVISLLCDRFSLVRRPSVMIAGIGPGSRETMTEEVRRAIAQADCLIGAARMLEAAALPGQKTIPAIAPEAIARSIREETDSFCFTVVMSGDSGFFSGTKKLLPLLKDCRVQVLPGISSMAYLCARLGTSYEDVRAVSLHGRTGSVAAEVRRWGRVFALVGGGEGTAQLCRSLMDAGLGEARLTVGQRLSYPEEKITTGSARELAQQRFDSLSAVLIESELPPAPVTHGLPDGVFGREAGIPMTKQEVRTLCLSQLQIPRNAVCWDIGAGTGSVSIEMALQAMDGQVWAVEQRQDAATLLESNRRRFGLEHLSIVRGTAPDCCQALPAPTHVFIGGSSGKIEELLALIWGKNPSARVVATAVTLETIANLTQCIRRFRGKEQSVIAVSAARAESLGSFHLMKGQNPVYIFTMEGSNGEG